MTVVLGKEAIDKLVYGTVTDPYVGIFQMGSSGHCDCYRRLVEEAGPLSVDGYGYDEG
jgi:hypothetical protein